MNHRTRSNAIGVAFLALCGVATFLIIAMLAVVLGQIIWHGLPGLSLEFLSAAPSQGMRSGGIFPAIFGTFALVVLMTLAVVPMGVLTSIYLVEYSRPGSRFARFVNQAVNNLAGVPSIVFGLFGLGFFVRFVGSSIDQVAFGGQLVFGQPAILWAALTLALLTLPVVIVTTTEALRAVPVNAREASLALGATKWQTISRVVLPQCTAGVLTGAILAVSRGAGEVAPIMFTGAAYFLPSLPTQLNDQFMELGYHIYVMSTQSPNVEETKPVLFATVFVLLALTFALNATAIGVRSRFRQGLRPSDG
ncbi:MAG: phosphate ABC transporter permease PstA [Deltaproteobacteria bacterium]|nr:phosphate ABC transporter permease PstA [Deltaproteobacteria bacterium]